MYLAILGSAKWCNIYGSGWVCCFSSPLPTWAAKPWPRVFVQPTSCHPSYHYVMYDGCSCLMIAIWLRITASLIHKRTIPGCPQLVVRLLPLRAIKVVFVQRYKKTWAVTIRRYQTESLKKTEYIRRHDDQLCETCFAYVFCLRYFSQGACDSLVIIVHPDMSQLLRWYVAPSPMICHLIQKCADHAGQTVLIFWVDML